MPNWCDNTVSIIASPEAIREITEIANRVIGDEAKKNFCQELLPMPEGLVGTVSPSNDPIRKAELTALYGAGDWWDWQIANWGVKWGDSEFRITEVTDNCLSLYFQTPWGPPEPVFRYISRLWSAYVVVTYSGEVDCPGVLEYDADGGESEKHWSGGLDHLVGRPEPDYTDDDWCDWLMERDEAVSEFLFRNHETLVNGLRLAL